MRVQRRPRNHTAIRLICRFLAGRSMDGIQRTNATWLRRADRDLTPGQRASRWHHKAGWERTAWRVNIVAFLTAAVYGSLTARTLTIVCLLAALGVSLAWDGWRAYRAMRAWSHTRNIVRPLWRTLAPIAGHPPGDEHGRYLTIPHNYRSLKDPVIKLELSPTWEGTVSDQKRVTQLVSRRLGGEWEARWYHHIHKVEFVPAPAPPAKVAFADIRSIMDSAADNELVLGMAAGNDPAKINLDFEPHTALSIRTGLGKTTILRSFIAQGSRKGWYQEIIDPKLTSLNEFSGIIPIHRTVESQMKAIQRFREEMDRRYVEIGESDKDYDGQRWVLYIEEANSFVQELKEYWAEYRSSLTPQERASTSKHNPALADFSFLIFKGRACKIHIVAVFQRMSGAATPGGGDIREQFGTKIVNCSPATWLMIIGTRPVPKPSKIRGRVICVIADETRNVQSAFLTKDEAKTYALSGAGNLPDDPARLASVTRLPEPEPERYTLREACEAKVIPMRYSAARKARSRDPAFPAGQPTRIGIGYTADELLTWFTGRSRIRATA